MQGLQRRRIERCCAWVVLLAPLALVCLGCATHADPAATQRPAPPNAADTPVAPPPRAQEPIAPPRVVLSPPGKDPVSVRVEVAATVAERQRGLMFREHMDADAGMIFLFERPQQLSFWMHNTHIPLDMIFIRDDMTVLGVVENAEPRTDDSRQVPGMSQYVLEVNAGFAREHGIATGVLTKFEGIEGTRR